MWRGSLLPLGCEAAPNQPTAFCLEKLGRLIGAAAQPNGSKLPRHKGRCQPAKTSDISHNSQKIPPAPLVAAPSDALK
ncbi:hypothetical protein CEC48_18405 [Pseudomonas sp. K2I15]|nr:hypothetical protein CEC48_18405 [Pseudomonas sp. K2I15]